ncbi:sensor histidine kinase [Wohlfahrtiimonas chitiniclastica]|uniref:sensor histidine kinase n=1 Tax=Wohlfahrtiimonas chitiniclastica TaxID=400946 RepID=UPI000364860C|nr:HAMP domain-containing sensor histidine kinase [Wohlfahrtiimonas chitiniclastica]
MMQAQQIQPTGVPMQLLGIFRLIMAVILSSVYILSARVSPEALPISQYFHYILLTYLVFLLISTLILKRVRYQTTRYIFFFGLLDLGFISALCYFTDGLDSPLVILLLISFMVHGAFLSRIGALLLLGVSVCIQLMLWLKFDFDPKIPEMSWYQLMVSQGILRLIGQNCFAFVALILTNLWLHKYEASQRLVEAQNEQLRNAAILHEAVVQQSKSGLIVLNSEGKVILVNQYIKSWFGDMELKNSHLMEYLPTLTERFYLWSQLKFLDPSLFEYNDHKYYIEFSEIDLPTDHYSVIQIEPMETVSRRAQQEKLVALGHLTAAIAHEIRNPMASIYQASQLLGEQQNLNTVEKRLIDMINNNVQRANRIINDVLVLARKNEAERQYIKLEGFLNELLDEFFVEFPHMVEHVHLIIHDDVQRVLFDLSVLRQVVHNLITNAVIHSGIEPTELHITLEAEQKGNTTILSIYDNGVGVADNARFRLFEPFFTTHKKGTGLGLYITKELCAANGSIVQYVDDQKGRHGFRIVFAKVV